MLQYRYKCHNYKERKMNYNDELQIYESTCFKIQDDLNDNVSFIRIKG